MSDGNGEHKDQQQPPAGIPEPEKKVSGELPAAVAPDKNPDNVIQILYRGDGTFQAAGPGDGRFFDEPLCLWMLDKAKDFIKASNARKRQAQAKAGIILPGSTLRRPM